MSGLLIKEVSKHIEMPRALTMQDSWARECFSHGLIEVLTNPVELEHVPARIFWKEAQVPQADIDTLLTPDGNFAYKINMETLTALFDLPLETFVVELKALIRPLYAPVQPTLDAMAPSEFGFNNHEFDQHVRDVYRNIRKIMKLAGADDRETKLAVFAALIHDAGNAYGRSVHAPIIDYLLTEVFDSSQHYDTELAVAILAALTHESSMALPLLEAAMRKSREGDDETVNYSHFFDLYSKLNSRIASALRISDKVLAAHPNRLLNTKILTSLALEGDPHFLLSALFAFKRLSRVNNAFRVEIAFSLASQKVLQNHPELSKDRSHHKGKKINLPSEMKQKVVEQEPMTPYFAQAVDLYWKHYFKRMQLMVVDAFNLFPDINQVEIIFSDSEVNHKIPTKSIQEKEFVFDRATFLKTFETIKE